MNEQLIVVAQLKADCREHRLIRFIYCPNCRGISEHTTEQDSEKETCTCRNCGRQVHFYPEES